MGVKNSVRLHRIANDSHPDSWNGRLRMWEMPADDARYIMGVDAGKGVGRDRSVIEVIRKGDMIRPDEQVAEFASTTHDPLALAEMASAIGRLYGGRDDEALAVVEMNSAGGGDICLTDMRYRWNYSNCYVWKIYDKNTNVWTHRLGWYTNAATRPKLVVRGSHAINNGDLIINSPELLYEMAGFDESLWKAAVRSKTGEAHDDRVMALLMAYWGAHDEEWLAGEDTARARAVKHAAEHPPLTTTPDSADTTPAPRRDFINTAVSSDAYDAWAEELAHGY